MTAKSDAAGLFCGTHVVFSEFGRRDSSGLYPLRLETWGGAICRVGSRWAHIAADKPRADGFMFDWKEFLALKGLRTATLYFPERNSRGGLEAAGRVWGGDTDRLEWYARLNAQSHLWKIMQEMRYRPRDTLSLNIDSARLEQMVDWLNEAMKTRIGGA